MFSLNKTRWGKTYSVTHDESMIILLLFQVAGTDVLDMGSAGATLSLHAHGEGATEEEGESIRIKSQ